MPHYFDGKEAKIGDFVVGKGYNIKDEQGNLKQISGIVLQITPNCESCNIQILILEYIPWEIMGGLIEAYANHYIINGKVFRSKIEYGQANHFVKADTMPQIYDGPSPFKETCGCKHDNCD